MFMIQDILNKTKKVVKIMSNSSFPMVPKNKILKGEFITTPSILGSGKMPDFYFEDFKAKFIHPLPHALLLSDNKTGLLGFPRTDNQADFNIGFFVNDEDVVDFMNSIWMYYWDKAKSINK